MSMKKKRRSKKIEKNEKLVSDLKSAINTMAMSNISISKEELWGLYKLLLISYIYNVNFLKQFVRNYLFLRALVKEPQRKWGSFIMSLLKDALLRFLMKIPH